MSNSGWAVVVVVALVIVALFGYWAIEGGDVGDRGGSARIEADVDAGPPPAERSGGDAEVNIQQSPAERSGGGADVDVRQEASPQTAEEPREPSPAAP